MKNKRIAKPVFAKKSFGQNFLVDESMIDRIVDAAAPVAGQSVVEIGPGRGALTRRLLAKEAIVTAIELERDMIAFLETEFRAVPNLSIIAADALRVDFAELESVAGAKLSLVANLPYYISTAILQHLVSQRNSFETMVLMFQREVVERICAGPGQDGRGFLSVMTQNYMSVEHLFDVPPGAFRPVPKVWSSVVRLRPRHDRNETDSAVFENAFRALVSQSFLQKRKTLLNNLKGSAELFRRFETTPDAVLSSAEIDGRRRAETLTESEWHQLTNALISR